MATCSAGVGSGSGSGSGSGPAAYGGKRTSELCFLKRILMEEIDENDDVTENKLLFIAIHAVFLEFGFVGFDSVSGSQIDQFHRLLQEDPSMNLLTTSVKYTLPQLLSVDHNGAIESVVLKFQTLGDFVDVYGTLANKGDLGLGLGLPKLKLNKSKFAPTLGMIWENIDNKPNKRRRFSVFCDENVVVSEFWRIVKDGVALPLMIDLCEATSLPLPSCLIGLQPELKLRILEELRVEDIARMACVCKDMQSLASSTDFWRAKLEGPKCKITMPITVRGTPDWKAIFVSQSRRPTYVLPYGWLSLSKMLTKKKTRNS